MGYFINDNKFISIRETKNYFYLIFPCGFVEIFSRLIYYLSIDKCRCFIFQRNSLFCSNICDQLLIYPNSSS